MNVKKVVLCSKLYYFLKTDFRGNECLITKDGDKLVCPVNTDAVKEYFVKIKSSISRRPEKTA